MPKRNSRKDNKKYIENNSVRRKTTIGNMRKDMLNTAYLNNILYTTVTI